MRPNREARQGQYGHKYTTRKNGRVWEIVAPDGRVVHTTTDQMQALSLAGSMETASRRQAGQSY